MDHAPPCPRCGAANRADSGWCARCLGRLDPPSASAASAPFRAQTPAFALRPFTRGWGGRVGRLRSIVSILIVVAVAGRATASFVDFVRVGGEALQSAADPRGFKFLGLDPQTREPIRYNPCEPIHYVVNPARMPPRGLDDVRRAVARTAAATGLEFVYDGPTDEVPLGERRLVQPDLYGDRWVPVLIEWLPDDNSVFPEGTLGLGGSVYVANRDEELVYVTGRITLNAGQNLRSGFRAGDTYGKVLMHELGHVVGLDHVHDHGQVMNDGHVPAVARWGFGDLQGLRLLGRAAGCVETPRP